MDQRDACVYTRRYPSAAVVCGSLGELLVNLVKPPASAFRYVISDYCVPITDTSDRELSGNSPQPNAFYADPATNLLSLVSILVRTPS